MTTVSPVTQIEELSKRLERAREIVAEGKVVPVLGKDSQLLATSKSGTHWEPRDQGLDGGLVSSLRALL